MGCDHPQTASAECSIFPVSRQEPPPRHPDAACRGRSPFASFRSRASCGPCAMASRRNHSGSSSSPGLIRAWRCFPKKKRPCAVSHLLCYTVSDKSLQRPHQCTDSSPSLYLLRRTTPSSSIRFPAGSALRWR